MNITIISCRHIPGVMIGAGIFALMGQVAELAGSLFPIAFLVGGITN